MMNAQNNCPLCQPSRYPLIWDDKYFRVILINDQSYPGYCRVEVKDHIKEMTDLTASKQQAMMKILMTIEGILRDHLKPKKINLASLGNITPHLHWHIIPRYQDDNHFPDSVWSSPKRFKEKELPEKESAILIAKIKKSLDS
jgi:diadenosine tetraphosphate (Ap4A) HIT family hydrolase